MAQRRLDLLTGTYENAPSHQAHAMPGAFADMYLIE
jgi:hypothetical protein